MVYSLGPESTTITINLYSLIHFTRSLYWLQLHEKFGPIVINMTRVINDIIALVCTLIIFCVAFSVGMMHILDEQTEQKSNITTNQKGNMHITPIYSRSLERKKVQAFCLLQIFFSGIRTT